MKLSVFDIINSNLAINLEDGENLFRAIEKTKLDELVISFENIEHLSTLFLNESIGQFAVSHPEKINLITFIYPDNKKLFISKVESVIENALLGDDYDVLIDAAKMAL